MHFNQNTVSIMAQAHKVVALSMAAWLLLGHGGLAYAADCSQTAEQRAQIKANYQSRSSAEQQRMLQGLRDQLAFAQKRAVNARAAADAVKDKTTEAGQLAQQRATAFEGDVKNAQCAINAITQ